MGAQGEWKMLKLSHEEPTGSCHTLPPGGWGTLEWLSNGPCKAHSELLHHVDLTP